MKLAILVMALLAQTSTTPDVRVYPAYVLDCYDADTCTVTVDLGFGIKLVEQRVRLYGIDAYEVRGKEKEIGLRGRDWLRARVVGQWIKLAVVQRGKSSKGPKDAKGKYGRWLVELWVSGFNLNKELIKMGFVRDASYYGGAR